MTRPTAEKASLGGLDVVTSSPRRTEAALSSIMSPFSRRAQLQQEYQESTAWPAKSFTIISDWIPAFAGMTGKESHHISEQN